MANYRTGDLGAYYGSYFNESQTLTKAEQQVNVAYIYTFFTQQGWTLNAIAALCGNMQAESALNPGRWEGNKIQGGSKVGYGLVQWTPNTKYFDFCETLGYEDPSVMDANLDRIEYEKQNGLQWIPVSSCDYMTFEEFASSTESVEHLATCFLLSYERPDDKSESVQALRGSYAREWYEYILSIDPDAPITPDPDNPDQPTYQDKKKGFNWVLFNRMRRNFNYGKRQIY